jgi:hypothetical protein
MSRLVGTGQSTKQRLASYTLTPSQLPRLLARCMSMHVGACWWLTGGKGSCCRSAVCKRPRLRSMLTMPHLFSDCHSSLVAALLALAMHDASSRCKRHREQFPR